MLLDICLDMLTKLKSLVAKALQAPTAESSKHKRQGDEHLKLGRLDDAADCYRHALSIDAANVDACVGLGFVLSELTRYGEARDYLRRALSINSENADAYYILGRIAKIENNHADAIDHFTRALEVKPDLEFAHRDLAVVAIGGGQIERGKEALRRAISVFPNSGEFQFYLGNVLRQQKDYDNAIACYQKAVALQPNSAESYKNLADVLREQGRDREAEASYRKAVWFAPDLVDAHIGLGLLLYDSGQHDQAVACYERAVALKPDNAISQIELGCVLEKLGRTDDAIASYRRAVAADPDSTRGHHSLGNALLAKRAIQDAVASYEQVLRLDPGNPVKHLLAALSGHDTERAPSDYVEKLFDEYANKFDLHLVSALNYSTPQKLADLLRPYPDSAGAKWTVLDLGCGTGLSGAALAPLAGRLVGVDLSAKMLEKARERNLYHRLEQLDLLTMMQREAAASFDVVVAADVFVYIGKLDELANEVRRVLCAGGFLAFSVESLEALTDGATSPSEQRDYKLNLTGRYAHSAGYLARLAGENGFDVLSATGTQIRLEHGKPVQGYVSLWQRSPA